MTPRPQPRPRLYLLFLAFCIIPGLSVIAAIPWLKTQPDNLVFLLTGIAAAITILASLVLAILHDRSMGEWERSNSRFSVFWGDAIGTSLVALLLAVPVFRDWVVSIVAAFSGTANIDAQSVILAFVGGFITVVMARVLCMAVISMGWTAWKSRPAREA
ncbi:MAG: hypothetical protein AAGC58_12960 [Asticcacaulis sp.]